MIQCFWYNIKTETSSAFWIFCYYSSTSLKPSPAKSAPVTKSLKIRSNCSLIRRPPKICYSVVFIKNEHPHRIFFSSWKIATENSKISSLGREVRVKNQGNLTIVLWPFYFLNLLFRFTVINNNWQKNWNFDAIG